MFTIEELIHIKNSLAERQDEHALAIQSKINEFFQYVNNNPGLCLWRFRWDCGCDGALEGLFKATKEKVQSLIGKEVYFGDALGKHSDVYGIIEEGEIVLLSDDPMIVLNAEVCGYNPFDYIEEEDE